MKRRTFLQASTLGLGGDGTAFASGSKSMEANVEVVAGSGSHIAFDSVEQLRTAYLKETVRAVRTNGFYEPNGMGAALYRRKSVIEKDEPGQRLSNGGSVRWGYAGPVVDVFAFGARGDGLSDDTNAIKNALDFARLTRKNVLWGTGRFILTDTIVFPAGIEQIGSGGGVWVAWSSIIKKRPAPTELVFTGVGPRAHTLPFVTDMRTSGGVIENLSATSGGDRYYKLTSFMRDDGTPRRFSCAVKVERSGGGVRVRGLRIVLSHPGEGERYGINGYNNSEYDGLGSDWDVGFWNESGQGLIAEDLHVVGYWRLYGGLQTTVINNDREVSGDGKTGSEFSRYLYCNFQGAVGFGIRGGDSYRVTEVGKNFVSVEDATNLPFREFSSGRVRIGKSETRSSVFNYKSTSVYQGNCRLYLVEPVDTIELGDVLTVNIYGFGISNTVLQDCEVSGFSHATGKRATQLALSLQKPSAALEVSGAFVRGLTLRGTKLIGHEDVLFHFHNVSDITMDSQTVVESKPDSVTGKPGGRCIATSLVALAARVANPAGQTRGLRMDFITSQTNHNIDLRPLTKLPAPSRFGAVGDAGLFEPHSMRWTDQILPVDRLNSVVQARPGGALLLCDADGRPSIKIPHDGSPMTLRGGDSAVNVASGVIGPSIDNDMSCGSAEFRWQQLFAATGTIYTSDDREKQQIASIDTRILDAWGDVEFVQFKFNEAVERKGDSARVHFGLAAQMVERVFRSHGIDPFAIGLLCCSDWEFDARHAPGERGQEPSQRKYRYGIRYHEALVLEAAYQRRRMERIEEKLRSI
ncbi:tail fiber domain-containing protein [Ensifer sp. ENS07]|uniref:tail fiber domain-containing protein n=1 Tax=Ensifer sp. ENS07 TaxID=2769274 RepID=UPI001781B8E6|nr:tail fiber domain-containing protein [Ensifer sp. ENS07]MBD9641911.1 tail fiber domain-containing protein [Ensifer sp. ENS07]